MRGISFAPFVAVEGAGKRVEKGIDDLTTARVRMATLRLLTPATVALLLSLSTVSGTFTPGRVAEVPFKTTAHRARGAPGNGPRSAGQRAADRVIARRVRGAIRADPFLTLAAPAVKVTSKRGVVRLVGRVRGDKERSSVGFKAWQTVGVAGIDDRVTVGERYRAAMR